MKALKMTVKVLLFASLLLANSAGAMDDQDFPAPFDRIKEVATARGEKGDDGTFVWEKLVEDVKYWMVYSPSDGSVACGQRVGSSRYTWGIAYGSRREFQWVEAIMGQVVNFLVIEEEKAIEIANQFFKELETRVGNPMEFATEKKWVKI